MQYYKQLYRGQPIFYLSSLLLALLVGSMLISCEVANVTSCPQHTNQLQKQISSELRKRTYKNLLREFREQNCPEEIIRLLLRRKSLEWQCGACTVCNSIGTNLCEVCGEPRPVDPDIEWVCQNCDFINLLSAEICEVCLLWPLEADSIKKFRQEEKKKGECPVCFEEFPGYCEEFPVCYCSDEFAEDEFEKVGPHLCSQCNQAICRTCYKSILTSRNKACPLCRYENY